jgi:hypothetical protein
MTPMKTISGPPGRVSASRVWNIDYIFGERPPSAIAGREGGWIGRVESEGTRPALLPAGPVPERWNVGLVFIETTYGRAIRWTGWLAVLFDINSAPKSFIHCF